MKKTILFFLTLIMVSCNSDNDAKTSQQTILPVSIGFGSLYGNGDENIVQQNIVITNQADWTALKSQMDFVNETSSGFTEVNIDFDNFQLLASFDQIRGSGGYSIEISNVTETANEIEVTVNIIPPGDIATTVITQPFHIVKIPKSTKPVIFL